MLRSSRRMTCHIYLPLHCHFEEAKRLRNLIPSKINKQDSSRSFGMTFSFISTCRGDRLVAPTCALLKNVITYQWYNQLKLPYAVLPAVAQVGFFYGRRSLVNRSPFHYGRSPGQSGTETAHGHNGGNFYGAFFQLFHQGDGD